MSARLTSGANIALTQKDPTLRALLVGLGWVLPATSDPFELDLSVLLCDPGGQVPTDSYVVFGSQLDPSTGSGAPGTPATGTDDVEQIEVDLAAVPPYVDKVVFAVSIYQAAQRRQTFSQVARAWIQVSRLDDGTELARYDLENKTSETAVVFGELYRHTSGWKFRAVGQGWNDGLAGLSRSYGVTS